MVFLRQITNRCFSAVHTQVIEVIALLTKFSSQTAGNLDITTLQSTLSGLLKTVETLEQTVQIKLY